MKKPLLIIGLLVMLLISQPVARAATPTPSTARSADSILSAPAGPINVTLSPGFVNLYTDPGHEVPSQFVVTNNNTFVEHFKLSLVKYEVSGGGSSITASDVPSSDPYVQWIKMPSGVIDIAANQSKTIKFSITPPKDATLGYYYGIMVSRVNEDLPKDKTAVRAAPVFSVILEVNTPGAKRELQLVDFSTESMIYEYLPAVFNVTLKNTGNIHIVPTGSIFVDWGGQKDVAILPANPGHSNVLPQATREFSSNWDDGLITMIPKVLDGHMVRDKQGKPEQEIKVDAGKPLSSFRIGRYTAHLLMVYDNGQRDIPLEARLTFWVIPWRLILIVIGVILCPFALYRIVGLLRKKNK